MLDVINFINNLSEKEDKCVSVLLELVKIM